MKLPQDIGPLHFVGIGGIGMSGIAEVLHNLGYVVQGSDLSDSANVLRLREKGIEVSIGHKAEHLGKAEVLVVSSAIRQDNPELIEARARFIPVVRRAEMLAELMRFKSSIAVGGTHGKTTTTSMIATLLDAGQFDPTVINGGIINAYGTNARLGKGDWMVAEADESDGTFVKLPADVAVVTNIDPEHLDHYGSFEGVKAAFQTFVENVPFYGFAVMCLDHSEVQSLIGRISDRKIITYGQNPQSDVRISDIYSENGGSRFTLTFQDCSQEHKKLRILKDLFLPMPGLHNLMNATAALAVSDRLGVDFKTLKTALKEFSGVKRRFSLTGSWNGASIYDDYGHHPVEIKSVLHAAREATNQKVIAVMQPHRYSRLHDLFDDFCACFNDADHVIIAPIYAAGEAPIEGAGQDDLIEGLKARGHRSVLKLDDPKNLAALIAKLATKDDIILCLGAGSISNWAYALPEQLKAFPVSSSDIKAVS